MSYVIKGFDQLRDNLRCAPAPLRPKMTVILQRALKRRPDKDQNVEAESPKHVIEGHFRSTETINCFSMAALDRLGRGLFVVTSSADLLFANRIAESLVGNGLHLHQRRLVAHDRVQSETLHLLIINAARHNAADSLIVSGKDARCIFLSVIPCGITPCTHGEQPAAMLISKTLTPAASRQLDALNRHYALTPAEGRVAGELLLGDGIKGVAQRLNISQATARTHLIRLFQKTGAGRQAQLVRLILEWSDAIDNGA